MKKKKEPKKAIVHPDLDGFNIEVDDFGKIKMNYDIGKLNEFLNKNVDDKKLRNREDEPENT
jgi:hypothetical protein